MPSELLDIATGKIPTSGRFLRAGRRMVVTLPGSLAEATMPHAELSNAMKITTGVADAGIYSYDPKKQPPQLTLYGTSDQVNYNPNERGKSVDTAFAILGGNVEVVGYDHRGGTDTKNFVHKRR